MELPIPEVRARVIARLERHGLAPQDASTIADLALDAELRGKTAHGLRTLRELVKTLPDRQASKCRVRKDGGSVVLLDASQRPGPLAALEATGLAAERADRFGLCLVGMTATGPVGCLAGYAEPLAARGLVTLLLAGTPRAVVPPGQREPLLGTNPMCLGAPGPLVIDFATADLSYRHLMLARERGTPLPQGKAVDAAGRPTTDPYAAQGLLPFGDHRGAALALALEILVAAMLGMPLGRQKSSRFEPDHFSLLVLVLDPDRLTSRQALARDVQALVAEYARAPGAEAERLRRQARERGTVDVDPDLLNGL